jgi:acyl-CoA synthetase (AMP-forming)/AMP-acid ligase II
MKSFELDTDSLNHENEIIIYENKSYTVKDIIKEAKLLRLKITTKNAKIAITGISAYKLIRSLLAFDGYVESIHLLPDSLGKEEINNIIIKNKCTHLIYDDSVKVLSDNESKKREKKNTQWHLVTTGTTGKPKLIEYNYEKLVKNVKRYKDGDEKYTWALLYDPYRYAGLQVIFQALLGDGKLIITKNDIFQDTIKNIIKYDVNAISATPSLWRKMLIDGKIKKLNIKQITLGGEIADDNIISSLSMSFRNSRISHIYALTEAGKVLTVNDKKAGFPVSILNKEYNGTIIKIGSNNHLLVKKSAMPQGKEVLSRTDDEGFFDTQDIVRIEDDRVQFIGRSSGAINIGGNKVNPEYIEKHIRCVKGIKDVMVYGKKNSIMGYIVAAEVVTSCDYEDIKKEIIKYCSNKLEKWQVPVYIKKVKYIKLNDGAKIKR